MRTKRSIKTSTYLGTIALALVLLLSISLLACSSTPATTIVTTTAIQSTTTTTSVTTTTTATSTTILKPVVLKMAPGGLPNDKALFGGMPQWRAEVEKRTEGRVKIDIYYGETLAKSAANIDALQSGLADVIFPAPHHAPGKLPLFTLGNVPGLTTDGWAKNRAFFEMLQTDQNMINEFAQYDGVCIGSAYYAACGLLAPTQLDTLAKLNGLKISAQYPASDILAAFSVAPVALTPAEQYDGMLRKTVNALAEPVAASVDFKHYEVAKFYTWFNLGDRNHGLFISNAGLNKLTPADQKIIKALAADYVQIAYDSAMIGTQPRGVDILQNAGVAFFNPSADDQAKCLAQAEILATKWVTDTNAKGLPGTAIMTKYKELIKKYEAISPYKK
jgi:TRAP-type C4-dicarboxylate transport system substrate-binding protein